MRDGSLEVDTISGNNVFPTYTFQLYFKESLVDDSSHCGILPTEMIVNGALLLVSRSPDPGIDTEGSKDANTATRLLD